jgi:hypothetical protein
MLSCAVSLIEMNYVSFRRQKVNQRVAQRINRSLLVKPTLHCMLGVVNKRYVLWFQKTPELKSTGVIRVGKLRSADKSAHHSSTSFLLVITQSPTNTDHQGKMSWNSQHTDRDERDLEIVDSVAGSATACANISTKLGHLSLTTAGCLSGPPSPGTAYSFADMLQPTS